MPLPLAAAVIGAGALSAGGGILAAGSASRAANRATDAQTVQAQNSIEEQRRQFDAMRQLLQPYVDAGEPALQGILDLAGLGTQQSQAQAIQQQEQSPFFQSLARQGEDAILQNASATGGLRGGNTQGALAQFRPQLLNQFIEQQYGRLGGIAQMGQNSAAGVGNAGMNSANQISQQFGNIGAAQAGGALARGQAQGNMFQGIASGLGGALGAFNLFGGGGGGGGSFIQPYAAPGLNVPGTIIPQFQAPRI